MIRFCLIQNLDFNLKLKIYLFCHCSFKQGRVYEPNTSFKFEGVNKKKAKKKKQKQNHYEAIK